MRQLLQELANKENKPLDKFISSYSSLATDNIMDSYHDIPDTAEGKAYVGYCVSNGLEVKLPVEETIIPIAALDKVSRWAASQPGFDYAKLREDAVSTLTDEDIKAANIQIGDVALYEYLYVAKKEGWPTKISSIITLYHGTPNPNFEPDPNYVNDKTDYGSGLYLTSNIELAKEWAAAKNDQEAYVYAFELDTTDLFIFDFEQVNTLVWLAELCKHYKDDIKTDVINLADELISQFNVYRTDTKDVLFGWRGDSAYTDILNMTLDGKIGVEHIIDALHLGDLKVQYCLKSEKAYKQLKKAANYKAQIDAVKYHQLYNDRMRQATELLYNTDYRGTTLEDYMED